VEADGAVPAPASPAAPAATSEALAAAAPVAAADAAHQIIPFPTVAAEPGVLSQAPAVKRPIDLAALMTWFQEAAGSFSAAELTMLVTIATYAELLDEGLKQSLLDLTNQVGKDQKTQATLSDFSLALTKLEAIRTNSGRQWRAAA
jgi:hypothetical protein